MIVINSLYPVPAGSVFDKDDKSIPLQKRNGFTFINPDEQVSSFKYVFPSITMSTESYFLPISLVLVGLNTGLS